MRKRKAQDAKAFLRIAKERFDRANDHETDQRKNEDADLRFEGGEHWTPALLRDRMLKRRPTVTINSIAGIIRQGVNQARLTRPAMRIRPASNAANITVARYYREVLRQIERNSKAHLAYNHAREHQRKMGRGFWVVRTRWADDDSMEQVIRIDWIDDQHSIYLDPNSRTPDYSDRLWGFVIQPYPREDFKLAYPQSRFDYKLTGFQAKTTETQWLSEDMITVAEYYYIDTHVRQLIALDNGMTVYEDTLATKRKRMKGETVDVPQLPEGRLEAVRRPIATRHVWRALITEKEILEENEIPCSIIPIIQIDGERRRLGGKIDLRGQVRDVKEPARVRDYTESSILEALVRARTAPWLVEFTQIHQFKSEWDRQVVDDPAYLRYEAKSLGDGQLVDKPMRNLAGPDISMFVAAARRAQNQERAVAGTPDVFQEETLREQSGKAILARRGQQELGTSHYSLNEEIGIELTATISMQMIRRIYDAPRMMRIVNDQKPTESQALVMYAGNQPGRREEAEQVREQNPGAELFDVTDGRYEVAISAGRNRETDRIEAAEMISQSIQAHPALAPIALPILFRNADWSGADELAEALTKKDDVPPEVKERLMMLDQYASQVTETLQELGKENEKLKTKLADKTIDRATKERIAMAQQATQRFREALSDETKLAVAEMKELGASVRDEFNAIQSRTSEYLDRIQSMSQPNSVE